ncbi:MAG: hypothetical protein ACR2ME_06340 [Acidimicrobiia bacterium]
MKAGNREVAPQLLESEEASIRLRVHAEVLRDRFDQDRLSEEVRRSPQVRSLLENVVTDPVYRKWRGAHWVIADLADLGYPAGSTELKPLVEQVVDRWLGPQFFRDDVVSSKTSRKTNGVPVIAGRHRRCGSQQGNALRAMLKLGLADGRAHQLAERLVHWQWPDGGWNCDRTPAADTSSFMETIHPMRALAAYARWAGDSKAREAALRAAEVFLERKLFLRRGDGKPINSDFLRLHYPLYWHYDVLGGLTAMKELGLLADSRSEPALDLLESKRLADGGWPAEAKWYSKSPGTSAGESAVDWDGVDKTRMNPWVTVEALSVLRAAGRV